MTLKTYKAKSVISLVVPLSDTKKAWVEFLALTDGGSKFITTNTELQTAIEAHHKFGKLYKLESSESVSSDITEPKVTYYTTATPSMVGSEEIIDGSVNIRDLNQTVIDRMTEVYDENTGTLYANGSRPKS